MAGTSSGYVLPDHPGTEVKRIMGMTYHDVIILGALFLASVGVGCIMGRTMIALTKKDNDDDD